MITERLTEQKKKKPSEALVLRHFEFQNKHRRGNLKQIGSIILRHFYNSPDGKIDYPALIRKKITQRQAEKFISIMRKDGWLLDKQRGYAPINYPKIIELEAELRKQGFLWGFRAADNDVIWQFRKKAHDICLKKDKKQQAAKIRKYTNEEIRLKIASMIGKGYDVVFQSLDHFINYMAKFLEFELNTKKFLDWAIKKIKEKGEQVSSLINKTPSALQVFLKTLNHTVSYIDKIKKTLVFKTNVFSREEEKKENKAKEKKEELEVEMAKVRLSDEEMIHRIMGKPREACMITDIIGHMTVKLCQNACGFAKRYNRWFESDFTTIAIRGMMMDIVEKRKKAGKPPLEFYSQIQLEKYVTDRLREEKRPNWALEKLNVEEYEERCEFVEEQERHDKQYDRWKDNYQSQYGNLSAIEDAYFRRSAAADAAYAGAEHYDSSKSMGSILENIVNANKPTESAIRSERKNFGSESHRERRVVLEEAKNDSEGYCSSIGSLFANLAFMK